MGEQKKGPFNHGEAFRLMTYRCVKCGFEEIIWNSRDGVTPFAIRCQRCDGSQEHVDWSKDVFAPDHIPTKGQRVWVDRPVSLKRPLAARRMKSFDGTKYELYGEKRQEMIKNIISELNDFDPFLIIWELD